MKITKIIPKGSAVLLRLHYEDKIRGLHVPEGFQGQSKRAEVVATGPGCKRCRAGDFVLLGPKGVIMDADPHDPSLALLADDESVIAVAHYEPEPVIEIPTRPAIVVPSA